MNCHLTNEDRKKGARCRSFDCQGCREFYRATQEMEKEASKHEDIELISFVSRGKLIVLQTSQDKFETLHKHDKLNILKFAKLALSTLEDQILEE